MFRIRASRLLKVRDFKVENTSEFAEHLIERKVPPEWIRAAESSTSLTPITSVNKPNLSSYVPEYVSGWVKTMDRDAGDDERDFSRLGGENFVPDTKLTKYGMSENGVYHAVKTASPTRMIEILQDMKSVVDEPVASEIVSRIEYLSTTLSVKTIRLLLGALSDVPDIANRVGHAKVKSMVRSLGNELLCRFHALSLYSCASILTSLAKLRCVEPGTLNLLGMAFEKLSHDATSLAHLSDNRIIEHTLSIMRAYKELGYSVRVVTDTGLQILKDRKDVMTFDDLVSCVELVDVNGQEWIQRTLEGRIGESTAVELLRLVMICGPVSPETLRKTIRDNYLSRSKQRGDTVVLVDTELEDEDGLPIQKFLELTVEQVQHVRNILQLGNSNVKSIHSSVS